MTGPQVELTTTEVIQLAAFLLREVAEGRSTSSPFFWNVTLATEALRDEDFEKAATYARQAAKYDEATYQKAVKS